MNRYVVIIRVQSLYVMHSNTKDLVAGPYPRPDGWETAQSVADAMNSRQAWMDYQELLSR